MRKINPHKGGRTTNLLVRLEPEIKAWLMKQGSAADWITQKVKEEQEKKRKEG